MKNTEETTFQPDVFAITRKGFPMPAKVVSRDGNMVTVASPQGREYTFHTDSLVSPDEARSQLRQDRVAYVASSYRFEPLHEGRFSRSVRCFNPEHPHRSDYTLTLGRHGATCSCPAFMKAPGSPCKHLEAFAGKQEQPEPPAAPAPAETTPTYTSETW